MSIQSAAVPRCRRHAAPTGLNPLAAATAFGLASLAHAATVSVTSGDPIGSADACALLDAVAEINQGGNLAGSGCVADGTFGIDDKILLVTDVPIVFSAPSDLAQTSALVIKNPVTIQGGTDPSGRPVGGIERSTVSGTPSFRLIDAEADLTLDHVALRNGYAVSSGGAVYVGQATNLILQNSVISGNHAGFNAYGGGIYLQQGYLKITDSTIAENYSPRNGGGILLGNKATANIARSTISGNVVAHGSGGGIDAGSYLSATDTTIGGNVALTGAGLEIEQGANLTFCTISGNIGPGVTAAESPSGSSLDATASIFFGNRVLDIDATYLATFGGDYDIIGTSQSLPSGGGVHNKSCNAKLSPLFDNGGPTLTMALFPGSCAIDAGPGSTSVATDQRGLPRPVGVSDIGAFERQGVLDPPDLIFSNGFQ